MRKISKLLIIGLILSSCSKQEEPLQTLHNSDNSKTYLAENVIDIIELLIYPSVDQSGTPDSEPFSIEVEVLSYEPLTIVPQDGIAVENGSVTYTHQQSNFDDSNCGGATTFGIHCEMGWTLISTQYVEGCTISSYECMSNTNLRLNRILCDGVGGLNDWWYWDMCADVLYDKSGNLM